MRCEYIAEKNHRPHNRVKEWARRRWCDGKKYRNAYQRPANGTNQCCMPNLHTLMMLSINIQSLFVHYDGQMNKNEAARRLAEVISPPTPCAHLNETAGRAMAERRRKSANGAWLQSGQARSSCHRSGTGCRTGRILMLFRGVRWSAARYLGAMYGQRPNSVSIS